MERESDYKIGIFAALAFSVTWATTGVTVKLLPELSPFLITAGRCMCALLFIFPYLLFKRYRQALSSLDLTLMTPDEWRLTAIMLLYYFLVILAYQLAPVAEIALINGSTPVFVLIYKKLTGKHIPGNELFGAAIAIAGLSLIVIPKFTVDLSQFSAPTLGILVGLCSSITIAVYAILYRDLELKGQAPDQSKLTLIILLIGSTAFSAIALSFEDVPQQTTKISLIDVGLLLSLGLISTAIPTICYSIASRLVTPVITTSFRLLTPLVAATLAYLLLGEIPSPLVFPGALLITVGLLVIVFRKS